jgi:hypothetical protein
VQKGATEGLGFSLIAIGAAFWLGAPWLLLIIMGVFFVVIGNTGKGHDAISP